MRSSPAALLVHDGSPPTIAAETDGVFETVERVPETELLTRVLDDECPDEIISCDPDVVLVAVGAADDTRHGLGVEGTFATSDVPVVNVTPTPDQIQSRTYYTRAEPIRTASFDETVTPSELQQEEGLARLSNLVEAYQYLREQSPFTRSDILDLLNPPENKTVTQQLDTLPTADVTDETSCANVRYVADWIRDRFLATPGPVVTTTRLAINLGMTVPAFEARADVFAPAAYEGAFAETTEPRWWLGVAQRIAAERDFTLADVERARCVKCEQTGVDRAAEYNEPALTTVQPVHYRCSSITRTRGNPYINAREVTPGESRTKTATDHLYGR